MFCQNLEEQDFCMKAWYVEQPDKKVICDSRLKREVRQLIQEGNKTAALNKMMWAFKCPPAEAMRQLRNLEI